MSKDKLEALGNAQASRRTVLKGLLVGLGAGVLMQANGGVHALAPGQQDQPKAEKAGAKKVEKSGDFKEEHKVEKNKTDQGKQAKGKGEKKKTEEPKAQHKK